MYNIPYFKEKDPQVVIDFMQQHPFVMITGCNASIPVATQVPLLIDIKEEKLFFTGHIMKATDHHKAFIANPNVLCVFTGAHTYVSASWYTNPQTASTWNYMSVHARGNIKFLNEDSLLQILARTTALFENDEHSPALFHQLPKEYVDRLVNAIVAFEIEVTAIDNVFKLSQNRDKESYHHIIKKLKEQGGDAASIATEMSGRATQLFQDSSSKVVNDE